MKKKLNLIGRITLILLSFCFVFTFFSPFTRAKLFIMAFRTDTQSIAMKCLEEKSTETKHCHSCEVYYVDGGAESIVQFCQLRIGIVPSSCEYGFYYSPDDKPHTYWNYDSVLEPNGKNRWIYSLDGNNHGETRKICPHWFYYKVSF